MDELLHIEVRGKLNGRDAVLSIGLDAESAFEIEEVSTGEAEVSEQQQPDTTVEDADAEVDEVTADSPDGAGLDDLFPEGETTEEADDDDYPPLRPGSNQFQVAKALYSLEQSEEEDGFMVREMWNFMQEHEDEFDLDESWDGQKVGASIYTVEQKGLVEGTHVNEKNRKTYWLTDLGRATIEYNMQQ